MEIEGTRSKRFQIYRLDDKGEPYKCVCEFDTIGEVRWPTRLDHRHKIRVGGKFMTQSEFDNWVTSQIT